MPTLPGGVSTSASSGTREMKKIEDTMSLIHSLMHARIVICGGFAQSGVLILQAVSTSGRDKVSK